ncbi:MAG TPA: class I SAM-dependent methyltransferase [Methylomirabilota bacterium]|nr:class I SAM-dependent methyltransferase [Methylomirabilota bacterium]
MSGAPYRLKDDPYSSHSIILGRLGEGRGRRALDVGAADGYLAERLTAAGWKVTAVERDPAQAERAAARCEQAFTVDLERALPPLAGQYDAIIYGDVVEHLSDPLRVMREVNRHLAPGALVVVSVPNVAHVWVRLSLLVGRFDYGDRGILDRTHLSFFTRRTFLSFLAAAGLVPREVAVTPVPLPVVVPARFHGAALGVLHRLSAAAARLWPGGLAYQFVAVCAGARGDDRG